MFQKIYFMPKTTGTFADTLAAYGLAAVLHEVGERAVGKRWSGEKVWIRDAGPYYTIELPTELREEWVDQCEFFSLAKPIRTRGQPVKQVKDALDLDEGWERFRAFQKAQEALKRTARREGQENNELQARLNDSRPTPEFWTMAFVGERKMQAIQIYNAAIVQWHTTRKYFTENLKTILKLAATPDADVEAIAKEWAETVPKDGLKVKFTASQLFNPIQGKGQNRAKADALAMGNLDSFWLVEFLKAVGLWQCMVPRTVRNGDDRKAYVLAPIALTLNAHDRIFRTFAKRLWNDTSVKMDITASLLYTQALLEYSQAGQQNELDFEGRGPEDVVAGLHVATYKLLSRNAYTMMNLGFIGLPRWTGEVKTRARVKELKEVIKEHLDVIRTIEEERSDGYNLLVRYRDFLSGGQLETFFDFAIGYGQYLMGEWSKKNLKVRPFTPDNLRRLLMAKEPKLDEIIKVQGFRNLAAAIRHSTVIPQRRKAQGKETAYEPEYNLGMELKRVAPFKDKFVSALGAFIQSYNAETLRRMESPRQPQFRGKPMRPRVAEQDLDELLPLIDEYGPEVICNLLLAYGYAWEYRTKDEDTSESQDE